MIDLHESEHIIKVVRKHWFIFLGKVLGLAFGAAIPLLILFLHDLVPEFNLMPSPATGMLLFFYLLWLFLLWMTFVYIWTDYYLDVWVVTNERLFSVDQKGLFNREVSIMGLERVQDVTTEVPGFIATIFGFGNIYAQTAGEQTRFGMHGISNPLKLKSLIEETVSKSV